MLEKFQTLKSFTETLQNSEERKTVQLLRLNGHVPTDNAAYNINGEDFNTTNCTMLLLYCEL